MISIVMNIYKDYIITARLNLDLVEMKNSCYKMKNVIDQNIAQSSTYIRNKVTTTQTSTQVLINAKSAVYPWIRGGFSIGFAF